MHVQSLKMLSSNRSYTSKVLLYLSYNFVANISSKIAESTTYHFTLSVDFIDNNARKADSAMSRTVITNSRQE